MDELGEWFMEVFTSINTGGRLGPPAASSKRVHAFLEQVGGEGVLKFSTMLNIGNAEAVGKLASCQPDLGEKLNSQETQQAIDVYFTNRAAVFEPYRKLVTRCLSLQPGSTMASFADQGNSESAASEAWEKVFQLLVGRENDD
jgi:hypothetical protein